PPTTDRPHQLDRPGTAEHEHLCTPRPAPSERAKANAARRTCPECRRDAGYVIPPTLGMCTPCAYPLQEAA
ncbi:hypothetical protein ABZ387_36750, partial [Streptomyces flaveolus]